MTKHSLEGLLICKNISNQVYQKAIKRLIEWTEAAYNVNVYLDEETNYFIPTPIEELEELDYNFGDIEIDKYQPDYIKIFSLLHEAGHAMAYVQFVMGAGEVSSGVVEKETAAWDAGEKIAERLNFTLDKNDWSSYKDLCLQLYMEEK